MVAVTSACAHVTTHRAVYFTECKFYLSEKVYARSFQKSHRSMKKYVEHTEKHKVKKKMTCNSPPPKHTRARSSLLSVLFLQPQIFTDLGSYSPHSLAAACNVRIMVMCCPPTPPAPQLPTLSASNCTNGLGRPEAKSEQRLRDQRGQVFILCGFSCWSPRAGDALTKDDSSSGAAAFKTLLPGCGNLSLPLEPTDVTALLPQSRGPAESPRFPYIRAHLRN